MQDLTLTLIQSGLHWEDKDANLAMFRRKLESIQDADIIVLPEMFSTGFSMEPKGLAEEQNGHTMHWMHEMAHEKDAIVTGSAIICEGDTYYNRLIWMQPDGQFRTYDKRHLFSMAGEEKIYTPGTEKLMMTHRGWKICPMICYDLRFPVWIRNKEKYDLLIFVANWPDRRVQHWRKLLQARAIENQCYVAGVNRIGDDGNGIAHSGSTMLVDPLGEIVAESVNKEETLMLTLSAEEITRTRRYMPFLNDMDNFEISI